LTLLYSFPAYANTNAPLMQHTNGKFYGVSTSGGANNYGMVYTLNMGLHPFITFVQPLGAIGQTAQSSATACSAQLASLQRRPRD